MAEQEAKIARLHAQYPQWWNEDGSYNYPEGYGPAYYVDEKGLHETGLKEWCTCCNCPVGDGYNGTCVNATTYDANGAMYNWHAHYDLGERWRISGGEVKYKEKL